MSQSTLFHLSSRPSGHGITIGTPRIYDLSAAVLLGGSRRRAYRGPLLAEGVQPEDDILAFHSFPLEHRRQIWSTNALERLNREVGRRCEVVGIFPNRSRCCAWLAPCSKSRMTNGPSVVATSVRNR